MSNKTVVDHTNVSSQKPIMIKTFSIELNKKTVFLVLSFLSFSSDFISDFLSTETQGTMIDVFLVKTFYQNRISHGTRKVSYTRGIICHINLDLFLQIFYVGDLKPNEKNITIVMNIFLRVRVTKSPQF
jgi:hypothetical protein